MLLNHSAWEFLDPLPIAQLLKGICVLFSVVFSSVYNQTLLFLSPYPQMALTDKNPAPQNLWGIVPGPEFMNWNDPQGDFAQSVSPPCRKLNSLLWVTLLVFARLPACCAATVFIGLVLHAQTTFRIVLILCLFPLQLCVLPKIMLLG